MSTLRHTAFFIALVFSTNLMLSQEDLLSLVEDKKEEAHRKVYATFKTVRIGNAQTIETVKKHHLDYRIAHRFGNIYNSDYSGPGAPINETFQSFLGFDGASDIRNSLEYGVTDNLCIGIGRSRMRKIVDGSIKWRILEQTADFHMPISLALFSSTGYSHARPGEDGMYSGVIRDFKTNELHRLSFFNEIIIACKVTDWLSLELLPAYMYRNFIKERVNSSNNAFDMNGFVTIGFGGRIKLTKRLSILGDYYYNVTPFYQGNPGVFNPLSLGIEMETGGHVFSFLFTNAAGLIENNYIPYTTDTWTKGQVKFGFCISRTFAL